MVSIRTIFVEVIDKTFAWGFFYGSAAGDQKICGAGGMLFLSDVHFFSFKAGLGLGTVESVNFSSIFGLFSSILVCFPITLS